MSVLEPLIKANKTYATSFPDGLPAEPDHRLAVVTCMDCRIEPLRALGLNLGAAHVIRNAGGVLTSDVVRSLAISQHKLGTTAVMILQHTRCGLSSFSDEDFRSALQHETGSTPLWSPQPFGEQPQNLREAVRASETSPFLPHRDEIRGFLFDVDTGLLHEVECQPG